MAKDEGSSLAAFSEIIKRQGEERRIKVDKYRLVLDQVNTEVVLTPFAEEISEMVNRERMAVTKLAGLTSPPNDDEEAKAWENDLRESRNFLNSLIKRVPLDTDDLKVPNFCVCIRRPDW